MKSIREFLKRFLPPPVKSFMREVKNILNAVNDSKKEIRAQIEKLSKDTESIQAKLDAQGEKLNRLYSLFESANRENLRIFLESKEERDRLYNEYKKIEYQLFDILERIENLIKQSYQENSSLLESNQKILERVEKQQVEGLLNIKKEVGVARRAAFEAVWSEIFISTINNCSWLKDRSFSPGRWAVGYPYLYVMFRILNEFKPKSILELGLGQSTKMIAQFAEAHKEVKHYIVEQDNSWVNFFTKDFQLPDNSEIVLLDYDFISYKGTEKVRVYKNFSSMFGNMQFDFISIDGPFGADMTHYSRIDILELLPNCLSKNFIIMLDDYNRLPEQNTGIEIDNILKKNGIAFKSGIYSGDKDIKVWCSSNLSYYCSL